MSLILLVAKLFSISVTGEDIEGRDVHARSELLALPVVIAVAFAAIAEDELVRRRLKPWLSADLAGPCLP